MDGALETKFNLQKDLQLLKTLTIIETAIEISLQWYCGSLGVLRRLAKFQ